MKKSLVSIGLSAALSGAPLGVAQTSLEVGVKAPDFELSDSTGETYRLSELAKDKLVVLEFFRSGDW